MFKKNIYILSYWRVESRWTTKYNTTIFLIITIKHVLTDSHRYETERK